MVVLEPLEIIIENLPSTVGLEISVPNFPNNPALGTHTVTFGSKIFIEKSDFMEVILVNYIGFVKDLVLVYPRKRRVGPPFSICVNRR